MTCITFYFNELAIQVFPLKDLCCILKNGFLIWSGDKNELISMLENLSKVETV